MKWERQTESRRAKVVKYEEGTGEILKQNLEVTCWRRLLKGVCAAFDFPPDVPLSHVSFLQER